MPAKKGSSSMTILGAFMTALKLPFSLMWMVVFEPMHLFMWILVDKIGGKQIWGATKLMSNKTFAQFVNYTKEFRAVLCDYYNWPKIKGGGGGSTKCSNCPKPAEWWIVEMNKQLCSQCTYNFHTPGTATEKNSIEEIVKEKDKKGVHFLTPILPEIMLGCLAFHLIVRQTLVADDYLTTQQVCPIVTEMRGITAIIDANLFYYYKNSFASWCDLEDSFMRFLLDFYARTIVTDTDNTMLVFQTLPKALLFDVMLMAAVVPIFSVMYACLLALVYALESQIPRHAKIGDTELVVLEHLANRLNVLEIISGSASVPPETKWRLRESNDFFEHMKYWRGRWTRQLNFYYYSSLQIMRSLAMQAVMKILIARLFCIWGGWLVGVNLAEPLRWILSKTPLGGFIEHDKLRLKATPNMVVDEALIQESFWAIFEVGKLSLQHVPEFFNYLSRVWLLLLVILVAINCFIIRQVIFCRRRFASNWKNGGMQQALTFGQPLSLQPAQ